MLGNYQGSVALTINATTGDIARNWYTPYGNERGSTGTTTSDRAFLNQETDATGVNYLTNRYYDPRIGVFLSVDPLVETTRTPYVYGNGNPVTLSDPTGLCATPDSCEAAAAAAAVTPPTTNATEMVEDSKWPLDGQDQRIEYRRNDDGSVSARPASPRPSIRKMPFGLPDAIETECGNIDNCAGVLVDIRSFKNRFPGDLDHGLPGVPIWLSGAVAARDANNFRKSLRRSLTETKSTDPIQATGDKIANGVLALWFIADEAVGESTSSYVVYGAEFTLVDGQMNVLAVANASVRVEASTYSSTHFGIEFCCDDSSSPYDERVGEVTWMPVG